MTRRILLTGASGFLGRHAVPALLDRGFEVHAATRRASCIPGIIPHTLDLFDQVATAALMQHLRPSHLLHLAWDVTPGRFWQAPENLDWVAASLHLYRAFAAAGGRRATIAGTCAEYNWAGDQLDEGAPLRPAMLYGVAKHALLSMAVESWVLPHFPCCRFVSESCKRLMQRHNLASCLSSFKLFQRPAWNRQLSYCYQDGARSPAGMTARNVRENLNFGRMWALKTPRFGSD